MVILDFLFNYTVIKRIFIRKTMILILKEKVFFLVKLSFLIHVFYFLFSQNISFLFAICFIEQKMKVIKINNQKTLLI
jgi:hypothetical protein